MADKPAFMAHLVAAFPDWDTSLRVGEAMIDGGAGLLEVQFPFSDPTADGPWIQRACADALAAGFAVDDGFRLVDRLASRPDAPQVFVMVYANLAFRPGIEPFLARCRDAGARGVIVPDLPPDYDEGLYAAGRNLSLEVVPVVPVTARAERLRTVVESSRSGSLYTALRKGVTGGYTRISDDSVRFLRDARALGVSVMAGFGISERAQVDALAPLVDTVIVGSAFIRALLEAPEGADPYDTVRGLMARLADPGTS
ncbi:MAG: tryptophan synthase subunit alpha [Spirochaetaceae bacterium]|nr:tryptophan synthase subunit alpha [Spirochaetaceae bacterium]